MHRVAIHHSVIVKGSWIVDGICRSGYLPIRKMDQLGLFGRSDAHASIQLENAGWRSSIAFRFTWISIYASSMQAYTPTQPTPSHYTGAIPSYCHPASSRVPIEYLDHP